MIEDVDRIMAIMASAFDPAYGEAWNRAQVESGLLMRGSHYALIAPSGHPPREDEPTAGFALLRSVLDEEELLLIAIDPKYRRLGLGTKLLSHIINSAGNRGIVKIFLEMRKGNPAEYLYLSHGFTATAIRPNYYRTPNSERLDAVSYVCNLSQ